MVVDPPDRGNHIFDCRVEAGNRDLQREPLRDLRIGLAECGFDLETLDRWSDLDRADLVLFHVRDRATLGECFRRGIGARTAYLAWEPPVVQPLHSPEGLDRLSRCFGRILTWDRTRIDGRTFLELRYPHAMGPCDPSSRPFAERGLLVNLSGNKRSDHPLELYSARERVITHFEANTRDFELWGPGWDGGTHPSWKGVAGSKRDVYHGFRFALCLENMRDTPGYLTEKLFDCLHWGIVPVYWGDPRIHEILPSEAFVDYGSLRSPEALLDELRGWDAARHARTLECARAFLASPTAAGWSGRWLAGQIATCAGLADTAPRSPAPSLANRLVLASFRLIRRIREAVR